MNLLTQEMMQMVTMGIFILSVLALIVSVITQNVKNIGKLQTVATNIVVLALSVIVTLSVLIAYFQINEMQIYWYYIVAGIFASFFVALVATNGWKFIFDIWNRIRSDITEEEWARRAEEIQRELDEKNKEV